MGQGSMVSMYELDVESETLGCLCWCGRTEVQVPREYIRQGRTESCYRGPKRCAENGKVYVPKAHLDAFEAPTVKPKPKAKSKPKSKTSNAMHEFVPETYDPASDSSPSEPVRKGFLVLRIDPKMCHCGCEKFTSRSPARFAVGHDMRLRGKLIRAHVCGVPVVIVSKLPDRTYTAIEFAESLTIGTFDWKLAVLHGAARQRTPNNKENL